MKTKVLFTAVMVLMLSAWVFAQEKENRDVSGYQKIEISGPFTAKIMVNGKEGITIEADEDIMERIVTEVNGNRLTVKLENKFGIWNGNNFKRDELKITINVKSLEELHASAAADVKVDGKITGNELEIEASSAANIDADAAVKNLEASVSSGADISVSGSAETAEYQASSGGSLNAGDLETGDCEAKSSSGGDIVLKVKNKLVANASSGGDIRYKGSPAVLKVNSSSGGDVQQD